MKRSNRLVILVGVLLAVLAFVAIVILLNQGTPGGNGEPPEPTTVNVLVATQDIGIGDPVTPDVVEVRAIDPEGVQPTRLADVSQVSGQPALFEVPAGSQVTAELIGIGDPLAVNIEAMLEPGEKAITFQVDRVTGVDFLVKPGDTIDVVMSQAITVLQETADSAASEDPEAPARFEAITGLENQRTVKAILQDKRVLYVSSTRATRQEPVDTNGDGVVDETDEQPAQAVVDSVIIVFAGTDQDAEVIKFAQNDLGEVGSLTAVIRSNDDDEIEETLGITIDQLVEEYGLRIPDIVEQLNEEAAEEPAP